jgi:hypothetical protein
MLKVFAAQLLTDIKHFLPQIRFSIPAMLVAAQSLLIGAKTLILGINIHRKENIKPVCRVKCFRKIHANMCSARIMLSISFDESLTLEFEVIDMSKKFETEEALILECIASYKST